jgi:NADH-quinone oxidoreductase subunit J
VTPHLIAFYLLAALLVATAVAMVAARNTVHAVLFMAGNFLLTAVVYLLLHAPFLALIQVIVYAGAIMVLFLFVVMIMGPRSLPAGGSGARGRALALLAVGLLGTALIFAVARGAAANPATPLLVDLAPGASGPSGAVGEAAYPAPAAPDAEFGGPHAIGVRMVRDHTLTIEVVSVLLLVAMLGVVVLGQTPDT